MPKTKKGHESDEQTELLRNLLIVQLRLAGYGTRAIRAVVACENRRVLAVTRHMKKPKQER